METSVWEQPLVEALAAHPRRTGCISLFLKPHMWFFATVEIILSLFGLVCNCGITVSTYYAVPVSVLQRRTLAAISANYALISGLHLARNCFFLFAIHYPCISIVTTINCKLQEFPLVFLYIHCAILPVILAIQSFFKHKENHTNIQWTNACTVHQTSVLIICLVLALTFTAFDDDVSHRELLQCSIVIAIQEKEMAFWLITTLIFGHAAGLSLILLSAYFARKPVTFRTFFNGSLRDYILIKAVAWEILLLFTGTFAVYEFISLKICEKCLAIALEFTFIIFPLVVCCANPLLSMWFILPVRNAATELCPRLRKFLPEYDLPTPQVLTPECQIRVTIDPPEENPKEPL
ncbi:hypothetical protein FO519_000653 [Halicephalobus sp. NKZ332]|nr:hypothetical protein FO519_000653 [Halicephalobus sp. NKZ332]